MLNVPMSNCILDGGNTSTRASFCSTGGRPLTSTPSMANRVRPAPLNEGRGCDGRRRRSPMMHYCTSAFCAACAPSVRRTGDRQIQAGSPVSLSESDGRPTSFSAIGSHHQSCKLIPVACAHPHCRSLYRLRPVRVVFLSSRECGLPLPRATLIVSVHACGALMTDSARRSEQAPVAEGVEGEEGERGLKSLYVASCGV